MHTSVDIVEYSPSISILACTYFYLYTREFLEDRLITVCPDRGTITDIRPISFFDQENLLMTARETLIDLRGPIRLGERAVRAVTHAKKTLLAGFTTVRDLGTEGAGDADISFRKCLSGPTPMIPGPRDFYANRSLVTTGSYGPKGVHHLNIEGVVCIIGAKVVDVRDECRKAVRRQIGAGADWIKIYAGNTASYLRRQYGLNTFVDADYPVRSRMSDVSAQKASKSIATFHSDELQEIIVAANTLGVKTAVHLNEDSTASDLFGISQHYPHSLEHGSIMPHDTLEMVKDRGRYWVPTLAAYYSHRPSGIGSQRWEQAKSTFRSALKMSGIKIACGGDTGVFAHGENAVELKLMVKLGADWKQVFQWATLGGWECVRGLLWEGEMGRTRIEGISQLEEGARVTGDNDMPFGAIKKGFAADIIATSLNLNTNSDKAVGAESVSFVMKGGRVVKRDGKELL